ncbi:MAG: peptidoglycan-binding protein, partial [Candidatus Babeliales bacterium]
MKTSLMIAGIMIFLSGCVTMETPPDQNVSAATVSCPSTEQPAPESADADTTISSTPSAPLQEATSPETTTAEKPKKKEIQTALKNAGFYAGEIDGKFGPKTKKAIEEFQAANNLAVDGIAGPPT